MRFGITRVALTALLSFSSAGMLSGDTLTLRNGRSIEGTFLGGSTREIRMDGRNGVETFPIDAVVGIQFGSPNGAPASSDRYSSSNPTPPPPPPPQGYSNPYPSNNPGRESASGMELPSGTQIVVRMIDSVDSQVSRLGDTFRASIDEPVTVDGNVVIPRGAEVVTKLVDDQKSGKIQGRTVLALALSSINVNGRIVDVTSQEVRSESGSRGARSAKVIGGTTALGAIIGGIAGGGKGAAIGAGSGAAVGTGAQEVSHDQRVRIPSETRLTFSLSYSVRL